MTSLRNRIIQHIEDTWFELIKSSNGIVSVPTAQRTFGDFYEVALEHIKSMKGISVEETQLLVELVNNVSVDALEIKPVL